VREEIRRFSGKFRSWSYFASFDQFVLLEYNKRIGINISGIDYAEIFPWIDDPVLEVSDETEFTELAGVKNISTTAYRKLIKLKSAVSEMRFIASQVQVAELTFPYSEENIFKARWEKIL
jgi:hypothetical protein